MLRDAGVRGKLFAVLAIPTLLLVVATGWLVGGQVQTARQAGHVEAVTDVALQLNRVVHSLQLERSVTLSDLQEPTGGGQLGVKGQRQFTDSQLLVLREKIAASPVDSMSTRIQAAAADSTQAQAELVGARRAIDAGRFTTTETDAFYTLAIATDLQLPGVIASSASSELAQRLQAEEALSTAIEYASHERDLVELAYVSGTVTEAQFGQASALVAQQTQSLRDFGRSAPIELSKTLDTNLAASDVKQLDRSRRHLDDLLKADDADLGGSVDWLSAANPRIASMANTEAQLVSDIANVAASLQSAEQLKAGIFGAGAVFGLVLAVLLAAVLAQRITRPLRRLTLAAGEIGEELPRMVERMQRPGEGPGVVVEPIAVESDDEIGHLAAAFNTVNEVTLRVAKEQAALRASIAEMFVNVARRNQVLLGRQLAQLDKMEAREENPDLLKNLFRLDHLATRMRRNAESLLVLAGIDSTRRLRQAMPLSDVIRAAVGEIEAYERVDQSIADDPEVSGRHALSIAHLLAELLENATVFSNPGTRVVVATAMTGHGVDVMITDYGLGMSDEELVAANDSIAHPPLAEIAVSQRLGLFVVGRIAARLGATASLRHGRTTGTVVTVGLPLDVFEGLQVDEPVTGQEPAETTATADAVSADEFADVPFGHETVSEVGVLVGALAVADSAGAGASAGDDVPKAPVALFNPSEVALSRLPQVDVAALMAAAEADGRSRAIAAPAPPPPTGRRLLPRRSRHDEPVEVAPVDVAPVDVAPVDVFAEQPVDAEAFPADEASVADHSFGPVAEDTAPELSNTELSNTELSNTELSNTELSNTEEPEIGSHARRRSSIFARWRQTPPVAPIDTLELVVGHVTDESPADLVDEPEVAAFEFSLRAPEPAQDELVSDWPAEHELTSDWPAEHEVVADSRVELAAVEEPVEVVATAEPKRRRGLFGRRQPIADEPIADEPIADEPIVDEPIVDEPIADEPIAVEEPVAEMVAEPSFHEVLFAPVEEPVEAFETAYAEVADHDDAADEPIEVVATEAPVRRSRLFGRRSRIAHEPVAVAEAVVEPDIHDELFAPEPTATELLFAPEPTATEVLFAPEPAVAEPVFAPADEVVVPELAMWQVTEEPVAFGTLEPVIAESVAFVPVETAAAEVPEEATHDDDVADEPVDAVVAEEPARRRGRFGRRHRSAEPVAAEPVTESFEPADAPQLFAPAADGSNRESFAAQLPEPLREPEPTPAPLYFAPAIDILPGRPMGRRAKHGKSAPAPAVAPAAPVASYAVPTVIEPAAQPVFGAPVTEEPVRAEASALPIFQHEHSSLAPSHPPRQASAAPVHPPESPVLSELDQLALNAELHKSALSELRGLYAPSTPVADAAGGLIRRQPRPVETVADAEPVPEAPSRARDASEVRGMLTGFRAGVERGRSAATEAPPGDAEATNDDSTD